MSCHLHSCMRYVSYWNNKLFYVEITEAVVWRCSVNVLRNFAKFTGKHLYQRLFLNKVVDLACNFIKKESLAQVFSSEFCEIFKNIFFYRTPHVAASKIIVFKKIGNSLTNFTSAFRFKFCSY